MLSFKLQIKQCKVNDSKDFMLLFWLIVNSWGDSSESHSIFALRVR